MLTLMLTLMLMVCSGCGCGCLFVFCLKTFFAHRSSVANLCCILVHRIQGYTAKSEACARLPQGEETLRIHLCSSSLPSLTAGVLLTEFWGEQWERFSKISRSGWNKHLTICHSVASYQCRCWNASRDLSKGSILSKAEAEGSIKKVQIQMVRYSTS